MKFLDDVDEALRAIALTVIRMYQTTLSPDKGILSGFMGGRVCRHTPHCSEYAKQCYLRYTFFQATDMSLERISQCTPGNEITYDPSHYRVVFFSSAPIGMPFLEELIDDKRFEVVGIVTMPPAEVGRGMKLQENGIHTRAVELGISHEQIKAPHSLQRSSKKRSHEANEVTDRLEAVKPDLIVVIAYGKIIPQEILEIPAFGPINVHGSILPKYRGASPLQAPFLHGDTEAGVTIMRMNEKMDEGETIKTKRVALPWEWTAKELIDRVKEKGPKFLTETLREYAKGRLEAIPQDHEQATYCTKIEKEDGHIDPFNESLESIFRKYKAFFVRPKLFFEYAGRRIIIEMMSVDQKKYETTYHDPLFQEVNNVIILHPAVQELGIKPEGKKTMTRKEFLHGLKSKGH